MASNDSEIVSMLRSLALAVEPDGAEWLWQYEARHLLRRRVPDLLEGLAAHEQFREPLRSITFAAVEARKLNVAAALLRHHFFVHGMYKWEARHQYEDLIFLSKDEVRTLSETISRTVVDWLNVDLNQMKRIVSGQVIFLIKDLDVWAERQQAQLTSLLDDPKRLLAIMLLFYDGEGATEIPTLEQLLDRAMFVKRLKEFRDGPGFLELNEKTKAGLQNAIRDPEDVHR